jgi:LPXTG-motif cell wall-anchored protein
VNRKVFGAGAAGLVAALSVVPVAAASPTHPARAGGPAKSDSPNVKPKPQDKPHKAALDADFGYQKFRVGVQIKTGAFVPAGTTTAGSQVHIVETDGSGGVVNDETCTTDASTAEPGSSETYCRFDNSAAFAPRGASARKAAEVSTGDPDDYYYAAPGDSVTLTQTTVEANLVIDPVTQTKGPIDNPDCGVGSAFLLCATDTGPVTFNDAGLPPTATDDSATTQTPNSVDVNVLANDDTKGAPPALSVVEAPGHGSAQVVGQDSGGVRRDAPAGPEIQYTPAKGFVGNDSFGYRLSTANGSATATVHIAVTAPPPTADNDSASTTSGDSVTIHVLANDDANGGGSLHVKSVGRAKHGKTHVHGRFAVYTADKDFVGTDSFTYVASTKYGTDSATVTVTVTAPPSPSASPSATAVTSSPAPSQSDQPLANTGAPTGELTEVAAGLILFGGAAAIAGRRRRRGRHAD